MTRQPLLITLCVLVGALLFTASVNAQGPTPRAPTAALGTAFTYQGQLKSGGALVNNTCDFQFGLWDALGGGTQIAGDTASNVSVSSGLFTTPIDFGASAFDGTARWLAIEARCPAGGGSYTALSPRQPLTAAPFALAGGNFRAQNINLPNTTGTAGMLNLGGVRFLHNYGADNTFLGSNAGNLTMGGSGNTAVGSNTFAANTTGGYNTAIGRSALTANTAGYRNTAVGHSALYANTNGTDNTALGGFALAANTSGNYNTALGYSALSDNTTGNYNTAVGRDALWQLTGGGNNVAVGYNAGAYYTGTEGNNIVIGYGNFGVVGESSTIRLGSGQSRAFIAGVWGATSTSGIAVYVNSSGQLGTNTSSRRFKDNIQDMGQTSAIVHQLRPVTFNYKPAYGDANERQVGLIAEEVAAIAPWMVLNDKDGQPYTVRYEMLAPLLLNEAQKQQRTIQSQASEIAKLQKQNADLETRLAAVEQMLKDNGVAARADAQNIPTTWVLFGGLFVLGLVVVWRRG